MELELKEYFRILRKRLWIVVALVLLSSLITGYVSYQFVQPVYAASAKLIVNNSKDLQGSQYVELNTLNTNIKLVNTYKEIIKTPAIMDKVVERYPDIRLTAEQLISRVKVSSINDTQVMTVTVQDHSQEKAAQITNAIAEVFKEEISGIMNVDNVIILNTAKVSESVTPVQSNPNTNIAISAVVSLMLSIILVFVIEFLDDTIKTEKDIEKYLGIPTLGVITSMRSKDIKAGASAKRQRVVGETTYVNANR